MFIGKLPYNTSTSLNHKCSSCCFWHEWRLLYWGVSLVNDSNSLFWSCVVRSSFINSLCAEWIWYAPSPTFSLPWWTILCTWMRIDLKLLHISTLPKRSIPWHCWSLHFSFVVLSEISKMCHLAYSTKIFLCRSSNPWCCVNHMISGAIGNPLGAAGPWFHFGSFSKLVKCHWHK